MIDKTKPTCSLKVSETGTLAATYSDTGSSNISYYGFSSSYGGASINTQTLTKAGTYTYYVKDKVGNTNTCLLAVKTKPQYRYQDCISCKSCSEAGTEYGWELRNSGCAELHSNLGYYEGGAYYKRECYSDETRCPGTPNMCYHI